MESPVRFSSRTRSLGRSTVRELLKVANLPGMISFAGGVPASSLLPVDAIQAALQRALDRHGPKVVQYGETEGVSELRAAIASRLTAQMQATCPKAAPLERDDLVVVSGSQQALDLLAGVLLDPGDRLLVESPTYLAALSAFRPWGAHFVPVPSDDDGMCVDEVPRVATQRPKLLYIVPNFQNPQGTTLALPRRERLVELAAEHDFLVLEDDPYGLLRYEGEPLPSLIALARARGVADRVVHVSTFSKVLAPGLRVGFLAGPRALLDKVVQAKQAEDLHTSTLNQYLTLELLSAGVIEERLPALCATYARRRDAMLSALSRALGSSVRVRRPHGGMFLLGRAPGLDTRELLPRALDARVAFVPGADFFVDGDGRDSMRLSFSNVDEQEIDEGIARLASLLRAA